MLLLNMSENKPISPRLVELMKTLSHEEFKDFGHFIESPYFNTEAAQKKIYKVFRKYFPKFDGRDFNREKVYKKIYPGKKYKDGIMRNLLSRTLHLAEDFLAVKIFCGDEYNFNLNKLNELSVRKQSKLFENNFHEVLTKLENESFRNGLYYYNKSALLEMNRAAKSKTTLKFDEELNLEIMHNQTVSFMIKILFINVYTMNVHRHYLHENELYKPLMEGIVNQINSNYERYRGIAYLNYYFNAYMLAISGDEKYYYNLVELSETKQSGLEQIDRRDLYSVLANFCYTKINKGELRFLNEQFNIYRQSVESGFYLLDNGIFSHLQFMSIVVIGLEAGEAEWVFKFMNKHKNELDDFNRENTFTFCCAFYNYWIKNYSKALDLAAKVRADDLSYKHQLKSLYLKIYYDLNEIEPFYSHIDNYKHFAGSDTNTSENLRSSIINYVTFSKKLFDLKSGGNYNAVELEMLRKDIVNSEAMINKPWLLRKIEEIK